MHFWKALQNSILSIRQFEEATNRKLCVCVCVVVECYCVFDPYCNKLQLVFVQLFQQLCILSGLPVVMVSNDHKDLTLTYSQLCCHSHSIGQLWIIQTFFIFLFAHLTTKKSPPNHYLKGSWVTLEHLSTRLHNVFSYSKFTSRPQRFLYLANRFKRQTRLSFPNLALHSSTCSSLFHPPRW